MPLGGHFRCIFGSSEEVAHAFRIENYTSECVSPCFWHVALYIRFSFHLASILEGFWLPFGFLLVLLRPSWGPLWLSCGLLGLFYALLVVLLGALGAGQRVDGSTESGSVAGSGAQPLLNEHTYS